MGEVYNVGGHNERPNIFIVKTIIAQLHQRLADDAINETLIHYVADRLHHDRRYGIDPQKIKDELGWYPETPFEEGIVKTIDWYLAHEEWMSNVTSGNYKKCARRDVPQQIKQMRRPGFSRGGASLLFQKNGRLRTAWRAKFGHTHRNTKFPLRGMRSSIS